MQYDELRKQVTAALKAKDKVRLSILRQVLGDVDAFRIDNKLEEVAEQNVNDSIKKTLKQTSETLEASIKSGTDQDRTDKLAKQVSILEELLPPQVEGEALKAIVKETIAEIGATSMKDMKAIMANISDKTGGNFDKSSVAAFAKEAFAN